jgi:hypothetical protein
MTKSHKRAQQVKVYLPRHIVAALDQGCERQATSRSHYLKASLVAELRRDGIPIRPRRRAPQASQAAP